MPRHAAPCCGSSPRATCWISGRRGMSPERPAARPVPRIRFQRRSMPSRQKTRARSARRRAAQEALRRWEKAWAGDGFAGPSPNCESHAAASQSGKPRSGADHAVAAARRAAASPRRSRRRTATFASSRGVMTFDDQVALAAELLRHPEAARRIRAKQYRVILDEAQDTDPRNSTCCSRSPARRRPPAPGRARRPLRRGPATSAWSAISSNPSTARAPTSRTIGESTTRCCAPARARRSQFSVTFRLDEAGHRLRQRGLPAHAARPGPAGWLSSIFTRGPRSFPGQIVRFDPAPPPADIAGRKALAEDVLGSGQSWPAGCATRAWKSCAPRRGARSPCSARARAGWRRCARRCAAPGSRRRCNPSAPSRATARPTRGSPRSPPSSPNRATAMKSSACCARSSAFPITISRSSPRATATAFTSPRRRRAAGPVAREAQSARRAPRAHAARCRSSPRWRKWCGRRTCASACSPCPPGEFEGLDLELEELLTAGRRRRGRAARRWRALPPNCRPDFHAPRDVRSASPDAVQIISGHKAKGSEWEAVIVPFFARGVSVRRGSYPRLLRDPRTRGDDRRPRRQRHRRRSQGRPRSAGPAGTRTPALCRAHPRQAHARASPTTGRSSRGQRACQSKSQAKLLRCGDGDANAAVFERLPTALSACAETAAAPVRKRRHCARRNRSFRSRTDRRNDWPAPANAPRFSSSAIRARWPKRPWRKPIRPPTRNWRAAPRDRPTPASATAPGGTASSRRSTGPRARGLGRHLSSLRSPILPTRTLAPRVGAAARATDQSAPNSRDSSPHRA